MSEIKFVVSEIEEFRMLMNRMAMDFDYEPKLGLTEELLNIWNTTNEGVNLLLKTDLQYFSKGLFVHLLIHAEGVMDGVDNVEAVINRLKACSDDTLLEKYYMALIERKPSEDPDLVEKELRDDDYLVDCGFDYEVFKEFVDSFVEFRPRLFMFLDNFYKKVFIPNRDVILALSKREMGKFEDEYIKDSSGFIHRYFKVNSNKFLEDDAYSAVFSPTVCMPYKTGFTMVKDKPHNMLVTFGVFVASKIKQEASEGMIKKLGEPSKLEIVKLLAKREMYASEIAKELELNRATIGHHLDQLLSLGIVSSAYSKGNKIYYGVNIDAIREGFERFIQNLKDLET